MSLSHCHLNMLQCAPCPPPFLGTPEFILYARTTNLHFSEIEAIATRCNFPVPEIDASTNETRFPPSTDAPRHKSSPVPVPPIKENGCTGSACVVPVVLVVVFVMLVATVVGAVFREKIRLACRVEKIRRKKYYERKPEPVSDDKPSANKRHSLEIHRCDTLDAILNFRFKDRNKGEIAVIEYDSVYTNETFLESESLDPSYGNLLSPNPAVASPSTETDLYNHNEDDADVLARVEHVLDENKRSTEGITSEIECNVLTFNCTGSVGKLNADQNDGIECEYDIEASFVSDVYGVTKETRKDNKSELDVQYSTVTDDLCIDVYVIEGVTEESDHV